MNYYLISYFSIFLYYLLLSITHLQKINILISFMQNHLLHANPQNQPNQREKITEQNQYASNFQYLCAVIGFAVGYGSFWRFPYLVYEHGSQFVLIYFLILLLFGFPILYLETGLGQIHQQSIPFIFMRINKGLKFFGLTFVFICFHFTGYYNIILAYSYRFIISVFDPNIHFQEESIKDNKIFADHILHSSDSINKFEGINWPLFFFYIMSLALCYLIVDKGVKQSGKIIAFSALFPYFLFSLMLIRGIFLPGAYQGLSLLISVKGNFFSIQVWFQAIIQVFYQLTLACAGIVHMSSMKKKTQPFLSDLYWILASVLLCGLLCAANIFIYLSHFAYQVGANISQITLQGPQICFNIFPKALAILPLPRVWLFLFFFTMVLLGIDTMMGGMQTIVCYLKDEAKRTFSLFGNIISFKLMKKCLVFSYIVFIFTLTSNAGIHYLVFYDRFAVYIPLSLNICAQIYFFVYKFKFEQLQVQIQKFTRIKTPWYVVTFLKSKLLLVILGINLIMTFFNQLVVLFFQYDFYFYLFGWFITLYPYLLAYWYWQNNKQENFRLTFEEIQKTYSEIQACQRTSQISSKIAEWHQMSDIQSKHRFILNTPNSHDYLLKSRQNKIFKKQCLNVNFNMNKVKSANQ